MADRARRIGCLYVPDLSLAALLRAEPGIEGLAVVVTDGNDARSAVVACSPEAFEAGVTPGMTAGRAAGLHPETIVRPLSRAQVRSARAALRDVARSFSPRLAEEPGSEVCLDLGGLGQLFPSEEKLGWALVEAAARAGLAIRVGIASSRLVAVLAARCARTGQGTGEVRVVAPGEERAFLAPLPVELLPAAADLQAALRRFGIERLSQLAELPSRGLGRRLGSAGLRLWRLARGEDPRPLAFEKSPELFVEETDIGHAVFDLESVMFFLRRVYERLRERLLMRGMTGRGLFLRLDLDPSGRDERFVGLASSTCCAETWLSVTRQSLEQQPPRAGVVGVRVEVEPVPRRHAQLDLFTPTGPSPAGLDDTIARLIALSGDEQVGSPRAVDSHVPGAFGLVPFGDGSRASSASEGEAGGQPLLRAVRPPVKVEVTESRGRPLRLFSDRFRGRVMQLAGPWRLEGGWWLARRINRDYYEVELSDGGIYRLYLDRDRRNWFIDGICG